MLAAVPGLMRFADPPESNDKHLRLFARESEVAGKLLVLSIRRLPEGALSGAHHRAVHGVHPELTKLLGMLKYRYSYAQNVLMHSIDAAFICGAMAAELGLNEKQARRR